MSYCPGWFRPWREAFMAEKLRRFRLHWAWMSTLDQPAIIRQQSGREELIRQVRRDLQDALSEPPAGMGRHSHLSRKRKGVGERGVERGGGREVRPYPGGWGEIVLPPRPSVAERQQ